MAANNDTMTWLVLLLLVVATTDDDQDDGETTVDCKSPPFPVPLLCNCGDSTIGKPFHSSF